MADFITGIHRQRGEGRSGTPAVSDSWSSTRLLAELSDRLGINAGLRRYMLRDQFLVLCYHGIINHSPDWTHAYATNVPKHEFESQLDFLSSRFHLMSADELISVLEGRRELRPRSALITFDDGYFNNFSTAAAALRARGIPAIFNVCTGYIGGSLLLWPDEVFMRVVSWTESVIPLPEGGNHSLGAGESERMATAVRIQESCKKIEDWRRVAYLEQLRECHSLRVDSHDAETHRFMNWDQVRALRAQGFEIGSHTVSHSILSRVTAEQAHHQLRASKARIDFRSAGNAAS